MCCIAIKVTGEQYCRPIENASKRDQTLRRNSNNGIRSITKATLMDVAGAGVVNRHKTQNGVEVAGWVVIDENNRFKKM